MNKIRASVARKVARLACDLCFSKIEGISHERFVNGSTGKFHELAKSSEVLEQILTDYEEEGMGYVVYKVETGEYLI